MIKVLLVDDHRLFAEGIRSILEGEIGISVLDTVNNGLDLLQRMKMEKANIVLTDIRMPVIDGVSLTRQIAKEYPYTRVIALSMLDHEEDVLDMLEAGARGYLVKNVEKEELLKAIHKVAKGDYYLSPKFYPIYQKWCSGDRGTKEVKLTRRERQILELIALGRTSQQIAEQLSLSRFTVDTHRKNIHKKLGIKSNLALVKAASRYLNM